LIGAAFLSAVNQTNRTHRVHIKEKLGLKDVSEMVRFAIEWVAQEEGS
jgi:DNA-binding CsgD family transcriptional regulator